MPTYNATATVNLQYTPPGSATNSGILSYTVTANCAAQNVGQIDVTTAATVGDTISIPFGSISDAKVFVLKNLGANSYGIRINGSVAPIVDIAPNGQFTYSVSTIPGANSLTDVTLEVLSVPTATEYLQYFVFGD